MNKKDRVIYSDTDSLFVDIGGFLDDKIGPEWRKLSDEKIVFYIKKISRIMEDFVDEHCYREIQRKDYNSAEQNFRIKWKQEVIAKSAEFLSKKHYAMWIIDEEGAPVDKFKSVGLEIVRSDTPSSIKPKLDEMVKSILRGISDKEIREKILEDKREISKVFPEEIAVNIGASNIEKYTDDKGNPIKGAPFHIKGILNYRKLLKHLNIEDKYEDITSGNKVKVVYVKNNMLGIDCVSFFKWPKEFDDVIQIDYQKHIEKYYIEKITTLLVPIKKLDLLKDDTDSLLDMFFD